MKEKLLVFLVGVVVIQQLNYGLWSNAGDRLALVTPPSLHKQVPSSTFFLIAIDYLIHLHARQKRNEICRATPGHCGPLWAIIVNHNFRCG